MTSAPTTVVGDLFNGGAAADNPILTAGADLAFGNGGNDTLSGLAGDDTLNGGAGNDLLLGGLSKRLTATTRFQSSRDRSMLGRRIAMPALLKSTSRPP